MDKKSFYHLPPEYDCLEAISHHIFKQTEQEKIPFNISHFRVFLPSRRACRRFRDLYFELSQQKTIILPQISPLGDIEEEVSLPFLDHDLAIEKPKKPISSIRRKLLLAKLISKMSLIGNDNEKNMKMSFSQSFQLANGLCSLLNQFQAENISYEKLKTLVPDIFSSHWAQNLKFLDIIFDYWPTILDEEKATDPVDHYKTLLHIQSDYWVKTDFNFPLYLLITPSIPVFIYDFIKKISELSHCHIILAGLDTSLEEAEWEAVEQTHPQWGYKRLFNYLDIKASHVRLFPETGLLKGVKNLFIDSQKALRPASFIPTYGTHIKNEENNLPILACESLFHEAQTISLILREILETKEKTAGLVTLNKNLAQSVQNNLRRWNIDIDDTAGIPYSKTSIGVFLNLILKVIEDQFSPVSLLSLLKHPLCLLNKERNDHLNLTNTLELNYFRGPKPPPGFKALKALAINDTPIYDFIDQLEKAFTPLLLTLSQKNVSFDDLLNSHLQTAEYLGSAITNIEFSDFWNNEPHHTLYSYLKEAKKEIFHVKEKPNLSNYKLLFNQIINEQTYRDHEGGHPRLHILGPIEAKLIHLDLVILGDLTEGSWPSIPSPDPWLNINMKNEIGLSLSECRIGFSAHDFCCLLSQKQVLITYSKKINGQSVLPSRWVVKLQTYLPHLFSCYSKETPHPYLLLTEKLFDVESEKTLLPPEPKPPVETRPHQLSVTNIEQLMRDPYAIYAKYILKLKPLKPLEEDPLASDYGQFIHACLDLFLKKHPNHMPNKALDELLNIGKKLLKKHKTLSGVWSLWWPKFERIAEWFILNERKIEKINSITEKKLYFKTTIKNRPFTLIAKADRIDIKENNTYSVIDYKTGTPPSQKEVYAGYAPQLSLEALLLRKNSDDSHPISIAELSYWKLKGTDPAGEIYRFSHDINDVIDQTEKGLYELIGRFYNPDTAYLSQPNPELAPKYSDYDHLARIKEWNR